MPTIRVTLDDILHGEAGQCHQCAVARALQRRFPDSDANVYERDWVTWIQVWAVHVEAPWKVIQFTRQFDQLPRNSDGTLALDMIPKVERPKPFKFTVPVWKDRQWRERCYGCEELVDPKDLDDEQYCPECSAAFAGA